MLCSEVFFVVGGGIVQFAMEELLFINVINHIN